ANASRAFRQPFLFAGVLTAGTTAVPLPNNEGWRVWVDTTRAGFLSAHPPGADEGDDAPVYLVTVGRPGLADAARFLSGATVLDKDPEAVLEEQAARDPPLVYVSGARHDGFLLTVRYPRQLEPLKATPLAVGWVGVEGIGFSSGGARGMVQTEGVPVDQAMAQAGGLPPLPWPRFRDGGVLTAGALNEQ